jgi:hypothetical protein
MIPDTEVQNACKNINTNQRNSKGRVIIPNGVDEK